MTDSYTENLAEFGTRELQELKEILTAWLDKGLPDNFDDTGVRPAMNKNSGYVFLVNEDYQVAMMNGDQLEIFHSLPYGGAEGFLSDLLEENAPSDLNEDDVEYLLDAINCSSFNVQLPWLNLKKKNY